MQPQDPVARCHHWASPARAAALAAALLALLIARVCVGATSEAQRECARTPENQIACGDIQIGLTQAEYEAGLGRREQIFRDEEASSQALLKSLLERSAHGSDAEKATLRAQIAVVNADRHTLAAELRAVKQHQLRLRASFDAFALSMAQARTALDTIGSSISAGNFDAASTAISTGDVHTAQLQLEVIADIVGRFAERPDEKEALAIFAAGRLAEARVVS